MLGDMYFKNKSKIKDAECPNETDVVLFTVSSFQTIEQSEAKALFINKRLHFISIIDLPDQYFNLCAGKCIRKERTRDFAFKAIKLNY